MAAPLFILSAVWWPKFKFTTDQEEPTGNEGWRLDVVTPDLPIYKDLRVADRIELCLNGEPTGAGLTCFFLAYQPAPDGLTAGQVRRSTFLGEKMPNVEIPLALRSPFEKIKAFDGDVATLTKMMRSAITKKSPTVRQGFVFGL